MHIINRTKLVTSNSFAQFESELNTKIAELNDDPYNNAIIDIKYSMALHGENAWYTALIIYNTNHPLED